MNKDNRLGENTKYNMNLTNYFTSKQKTGKGGIGRGKITLEC